MSHSQREKTCRRCKQAKETSEFYKSSNYKDGLRSWCKECYNAYIHERFKKKYQTDPTFREKYLKRKRERERKRRSENREIINEKQRLKYRRLMRNPEFREKERIRKRGVAKRRRLKVLEHYSNGQPKCACCGETEINFLSIDHINGDGKSQTSKIGGYSYLYAWLIKNNFPDGFQVLCYNCNMAKGFYGVCPHQKMKEIGLLVAISP